jgi:vacuolar-type H+-ATPase subunit H
LCKIGFFVVTRGVQHKIMAESSKKLPEEFPSGKGEKTRDRFERSSERLGKANKLANSSKGKSLAQPGKSGEKENSEVVANSNDKMLTLLQQIQESMKRTR